MESLCTCPLVFPFIGGPIGVPCRYSLLTLSGGGIVRVSQCRKTERSVWTVTSDTNSNPSPDRSRSDRSPRHRVVGSWLPFLRVRNFSNLRSLRYTVSSVFVSLFHTTVTPPSVTASPLQGTSSTTNSSRFLYPSWNCLGHPLHLFELQDQIPRRTRSIPSLFLCSTQAL